MQVCKTTRCVFRPGRFLTCVFFVIFCCASELSARGREKDSGFAALLETPESAEGQLTDEHAGAPSELSERESVPNSSDPEQTTSLFQTTAPEAVFDGRSPPLSQESVFLEDDPPNDPSGSALPSGIPNGSEEIQSLKEPEDTAKGVSFRRLSKEPYANYRQNEARWSWLPGSGDDFGWLSFQGSPYGPRGKRTEFGGSFGMHLLGGPTSSPVPPRLYDFVFGVQSRDSLSDRFSYDLAATIGVFSDFEGSAREGVRFPGHAVGMVHINGTTDFVFGVDYLDRDDIAVLPVVGVSLHDHFLPGLRFDLVFPRPRIDYVLTDDWRSYLTAGLDGGTWDVQFPNGTGQVMTYRDYRLMLGFEHSDSAVGISAWEFGYAFGRELEFRNNPGSTRFDDAFVLQWVWRR